MNLLILKRGDVVTADFRGAEGTEKQGRRSCVIVQNDIGNAKSPLTIVAPLTDAGQFKGLPVQVLVSAAELGNGGKDSCVECGHIRSIDRNRIGRRVSSLNAVVMSRIDAALRVSLDLR
ncbi:type II toxin-antitoxin system PemK/MazF family toxin [Luteolibacter sp. Populi]|uniref:type II toxin-antitoxin system PemK/MazF family toxin n=1 Tax=Luteolibacter sp. Populi TaxID=3230487 RepID=UPI0034654463